MEARSGWFALQHADWLAAVAALARGGPGTSADPRDIAAAVGRSPDVDGGFEDPDDERIVAVGFGIVVQMWRQLGAVDADDRLTPLGWWGLPEALRRAWTHPPTKTADASAHPDGEGERSQAVFLGDLSC